MFFKRKNNQQKQQENQQQQQKDDRDRSVGSSQVNLFKNKNKEEFYGDPNDLTQQRDFSSSKNLLSQNRQGQNQQQSSSNISNLGTEQKQLSHMRIIDLGDYDPIIHTMKNFKFLIDLHNKIISENDKISELSQNESGIENLGKEITDCITTIRSLLDKLVKLGEERGFGNIEVNVLFNLLYDRTTILSHFRLSNGINELSSTIMELKEELNHWEEKINDATQEQKLSYNPEDIFKILKNGINNFNKYVEIYGENIFSDSLPNKGESRIKTKAEWVKYIEQMRTLLKKESKILDESNLKGVLSLFKKSGNLLVNTNDSENLIKEISGKLWGEDSLVNLELNSFMSEFVDQCDRPLGPKKFFGITPRRFLDFRRLNQETVDTLVELIAIMKNKTISGVQINNKDREAIEFKEVENKELKYIFDSFTSLFKNYSPEEKHEKNKFSDSILSIHKKIYNSRNPKPYLKNLMDFIDIIFLVPFNDFEEPVVRKLINRLYILIINIPNINNEIEEINQKYSSHNLQEGSLHSLENSNFCSGLLCWNTLFFNPKSLPPKKFPYTVKTDLKEQNFLNQNFQNQPMQSVSQKFRLPALDVKGRKRPNSQKKYEVKNKIVEASANLEESQSNTGNTKRMMGTKKDKGSSQIKKSEQFNNLISLEQNEDEEDKNNL
ncbi:MAG: hypothetical protein N4A49_08200 [Marinifilaceae bacterium]|jgi:hypothetical protein|nr:hypothetical protein [Marinifilaceae bacterium]